GLSEKAMTKCLEAIFKGTGFRILPKDKINAFKLQFFSDYTYDYFYELQNELFMGEFDDWELVQNPPIMINNFVVAIMKILDISEVFNLTLILTSYASKDRKSKNVVKCKIKDIYYKMFSASSYWMNLEGAFYVDNLIIEITQD
ncbi:MAG: hypothetical protein ACRCUS_07375, partial [Anaerovoracaceae bacterium]